MRKILGSLLAVACVTGLSTATACAQGGGVGGLGGGSGGAYGVPQTLKVVENRVTLAGAGLPSIILNSVLDQAKRPCVNGAIGTTFLSIDVKDVPLEQALEVICRASTPRLQWADVNGIIVISPALPEALQPVPSPPAPQVNVTNNIPKPDGITASVAVSGPNALNTFLELQLLGLQAERRKLIEAGWVPSAPKVRQKDAEIRMFRQFIDARRGAKLDGAASSKAVQATRHKPVRTAQRG